ncbi:hypothetical protein [Caballeronia sp. dw_276]|jgi:hypothetical protein|uniref:hypothetical protein n=1 Tax=Caballeronia sp. dw_276 TaxID=2719795 RepID=UPI001BD30529|nr:hypothetical protein [Caballeronia sp. dw_276]
MLKKDQTCSVVVYSEETNTMSAFNIPLEKIAGALARHASFDVPLDDFHNQIDDDFARRLGGMVLLTLASRSQTLKNRLSITTEKDTEDLEGPPSV